MRAMYKVLLLLLLVLRVKASVYDPAGVGGKCSHVLSRREKIS